MRGVATVFLLALVSAGLYIYCLYPPIVYKRLFASRMDELSRNAATNDHKKFLQDIELFLADDIQIHLDVRAYSPLPGETGHELLAEDFDKISFSSFMDNVLYSIKSYGFEAHIEHFKLSDDKKTAEFTFDSTQTADGMSYYGGSAINMHFSSDTHCEGVAQFDGKEPKLQKISCASELHSLPQAGEENKLRSPEALHDFLQR